MRIILAFIKKDFLEAISYKFGFIQQIFSVLFSSFTFLFLSKLFGKVAEIEKYGGNYFSFVIIGIAFAGYLNVAINSLAQKIRQMQLTGTMEVIISTRSPLYLIVLGISAYSFIFTTFRVILYLIICVALGIKFSLEGILPAVIILILTITSFYGLGLISAGFIITYKMGDPISWAFTSASHLLGGVYYPIEILPEKLQTLSKILPITYSLEGMRLSLLQGYSISQLLPQITILIIFSAGLILLGIIVFNYSIYKGKIDGSLAQY